VEYARLNGRTSRISSTRLGGRGGGVGRPGMQRTACGHSAPGPRPAGRASLRGRPRCAPAMRTPPHARCPTRRPCQPLLCPQLGLALCNSAWHRQAMRGPCVHRPFRPTMTRDTLSSYEEAGQRSLQPDMEQDISRPCLYLLKQGDETTVLSERRSCTHVCSVGGVHHAVPASTLAQLERKVEGVLLRPGLAQYRVVAQNHESAVAQIRRMQAVAIKDSDTGCGGTLVRCRMYFVELHSMQTNRGTVHHNDIAQ
jgi:hypothetical protein